MYIKNAKLATGEKVDLLLREGKIFGIDKDLSQDKLQDEQSIDANGKTLLPAFVDLHVHFRTPGFEYKEDLSTGSLAAAAGGFTFVNLMPNTKPVCSTAQQAHWVRDEVAKIGLCEANQTVSITDSFDGITLNHLENLPEDIKFITEDGHGIQSADVMARAFELCAKKGMTIMSHAEVSDISPWDYRLAEDLETIRNVYLAKYYGTKLHMCHVSTRGALEAIANAKKAGAPVTCEVSPHHIFFDKTTLDTKVNPPIRDKDDCEAIAQAIKNGVVDAIATDHAPHSAEDKASGSPGMVGLESAFALCYTRLCKEKGIALSTVSELLSKKPAKIMGLNKGELKVGFDADVVLVDLETPYILDSEKLHSKSKNCPFAGIELYGKICTTIKGGKVTYSNC